jgi:hypothetical protein
VRNQGRRHPASEHPLGSLKNKSYTVKTKIKNHDLKSSKRFKFLHPMRFSYKKFNENDKLKFGDDLIYFLR